MKQFTKIDLYEWGYSLLGQLSIMFAMLSGNIFFFFFTAIFFIMFLLYCWMSNKDLDMQYRFKNVERQLQYKKEELEAQGQTMKFEAILEELREINKSLKGKNGKGKGKAHN